MGLCGPHLREEKYRAFHHCPATRLLLSWERDAGDRPDMSHELNEWGLPAVPGWTSRPWPPATFMQGRYCRVAPLVTADHGSALWSRLCAPSHPHQWTYMPYHRPADAGACEVWIVSLAACRDPMFHAVIDQGTGDASGLTAFLRIDCAQRRHRGGTHQFRAGLAAHMRQYRSRLPHDASCL